MVATIATNLMGPIRVTSALIGARTVEQLDDSLDAVKNLEFSQAELAQIDRHAQESGINIWDVSSDIKSLPAGAKG